METQNLLVAGAGQMGAGIAQIALQVGFHVTLYDIAQPQLDAARARIEAGLDKADKRGKLVGVTLEQAKAALNSTTDFSHQCFDMVIEAAPEREALKSELLARLAQVVKAGGVLATNTSSLSITRLAAASGRPEAFIGLHFMNPVPLMALVEVIPGLATDEATRAQAIAFVTALGKTPIVCRDVPGFAVNRLLIPMLNEACFALFEGVASADELDAAMKLGAGMPMGPLALADLIGLDTCLAIMEVLQRDLGDDKYRPCPLLRQYVAAGWLGKKSGRGFFVYG
ncbi:MAG: 3-hydroxybutyryl-CoA dehydrogenase [Myxococcales bacterium]|jgi:3-hydroxybutyryl-CoA dehydrogenase|nr:3-hydroxybutyryl-CoA dehydrogenase [Myxococcales bacterium]